MWWSSSTCPSAWTGWTAKPWQKRRRKWSRTVRPKPLPDTLNLEIQPPGPDNPSKMKKLFVKTYGCQMNAYDSAKMADLLAPLGYAATDAPEGADMVILNTCHIREKAAEKVYSELGRLKTLKAAKARDGGRMVLAVAGFVAQSEGAEIVARAPVVDL